MAKLIGYELSKGSFRDNNGSWVDFDNVTLHLERSAPLPVHGEPVTSYGYLTSIFKVKKEILTSALPEGFTLDEVCGREVFLATVPVGNDKNGKPKMELEKIYVLDIPVSNIKADTKQPVAKAS